VFGTEALFATPMIREGSVPVASGTVWPGDYSLPDPYSVTIGTLPAPAVSNRMSFQGAAAFLPKSCHGRDECLWNSPRITVIKDLRK
jgi:hypothetical protein